MCDTSSPHLITKKADLIHAIFQEGSFMAPTDQTHLFPGPKEAQAPGPR